jgi:Epoxide hydrolase N terminus
MDIPVPLAPLRDICAYWSDQFDWKSRVKRLSTSRYISFMEARVDDFPAHFLHVVRLNFQPNRYCSP